MKLPGLRRRSAPPRALEAPGPKKPRSIRRHEVVSGLLALYENPRYLEVGVCEAKTFHKVSATVQIAVDPFFDFDVEQGRRDHPHAEYHEVTSDAYFATVDPETRFDVIYLDGLHTFEQTLRDLINAFEHLEPNGVLLIDDTRPPHYLASLPGRENYFAVRAYMDLDHDKRWMGDVYRLVWFIDTFMPHLSYRTVADNHGQTVVWRKRRAEITERTVDQVADLSFEGMALEVDVLQLEPFADIQKLVRSELGLR